MPSVSELLTTIKDLSLVGMGDGADDARILRYFNMVYAEIYRSTAKNYPTALLTSITVAVTAGVGTLPTPTLVLARVKDTQANTILKATTILELEDRHPALDGQGAPEWFYMSGDTGLNTYPRNDASVLVRHIPRPATLTVDSTEADIRIPPMFHDMLIWGTLVWSAIDERDKAVGGEVNTAQGKYELPLQAYEDWLFFSQTQEPQVTEAVLGG